MSGVEARMYYPSEIVEMAKNYLEGGFESIQKISLYYAKEVGALIENESGKNVRDAGFLRPLIVVYAGEKKGMRLLNGTTFDYGTIMDMIMVHTGKAVEDLYVQQLDSDDVTMLIAKLKSSD